jgi:hypothetical protein
MNNIITEIIAKISKNNTMSTVMGIPVDFVKGDYLLFVILNF